MKGIQHGVKKGLRKMSESIPELASDLRKCGSTNALSRGKEIHKFIVGNGLDQNTFLGNLVVQMYGKCGALQDARAVFNDIQEKNAFTWNIMISAYMQSGHISEARELFERIPFENVVSCNAMIAGYTQYGLFNEALKIFKRMEKRDVISWNAMLAAYVQQKLPKEAFKLFQAMPEKNVISWTTMVVGFAEGDFLEEALDLFQKMPEQDVVSCTAMVTSYVRHGYLDEALRLFQEMPSRDVISWNAIISGHIQHGKFKNAFCLFQQMQDVGMKADKSSFVSMLNICTSEVALAEGKWVHNHIIHNGYESDLILGNALVNMYGKCGSLRDACRIFDAMPNRDLVTWSAMVAACAQCGYVEHALKLFQEMQLRGVLPDNIAFVNILSACSHSGLMDECSHLLVSMSGDIEIAPILESYTCGTDLLGRIGWLCEAEDWLNCMPFEADAASWTTLLGSCMTHVDMEVAKRAAINVSHLDPENSAPYTLLSNVYALTGLWKEK